MPKETQAEFRQAISERNAGYDGRFVYAVRTTGIYCKPSCASRAARPENILLYDNAIAAQTAGFRACKRCRPNDQTASAPIEQAMRELADWISQRAEQKLTLAQLAAHSGFSAHHLQRRFKAVHGLSPKAFQAATRVRNLKSALRGGDRVVDAMNEAGFASTSRLHAQVDGQLGMTPSAYRAMGAGERIEYAVRSSSLGQLLMAATARGVCFVHFGDDAPQLIQSLRSEYPRADMRPSAAQCSPQLDLWMAALEEHLSGTGPRPDLPLDIRGTAFQLRVWRFLMGLDQGKVVSYTETARAIGSPKAIRAAASACAANNIAVLIPCHRVLRGDGSLGGYRWGVERKRLLIDRERASVAKSS